MMTWYNDKTGNFHVGSQPTKEVHSNDNTTFDSDLDYIVIADKPTGDYYYDGMTWIIKAIVPMTRSELKAIGEPYLGVQIPFDGEAQQAIVAVTTQILADTVMTTTTFKGTTFVFSNGSKLRVNTKEEFIAFATWFSPRRQAFYQEIV